MNHLPTFKTDPANECGVGGTNADGTDDATEWAAFGITLGKVYFAKTLSLPPTSLDNKYYTNLKHHSFQFVGDQSFQFVTVSASTASQAVAESSDIVAFVGQDDACGSTSASTASPIVTATPDASSVAVDPSAIISALAPFTNTQAYLFKKFICRAATTGA